MRKKLIFGVGFNSEGIYQAKPIGGPNYYTRWYNMIERCYGPNRKEHYKECSVEEVWHDFQNYAAWMHRYYYRTKSGEQLAVDKDIMIPENKIY